MSRGRSNAADPARWPSLESEQHPWVSRFNRDDLTRAQLDRIRQPYSSAVVPKIADLSISIPGDLAADIDEATQLLTRFDAEIGPGGLPFASILLRTESASSSEIENLTSGARAIAEAELGERESGNAAQIVRNVRTMEAALALADKIDGGSIIAMQATLLGASTPDLTGGWRNEQVWIGGSSLSPHLADFVPPHQDRVPVSAGLLHDVKDYYNALRAYRRGELRPIIITAFARAAGYAVVNGRQLVRELSVSPPTAFRALDSLVERGVLKAANSQRRNRIWLAAPVLNALDDFAARAGRRRRAVTLQGGALHQQPTTPATKSDARQRSGDRWSST